MLILKANILNSLNRSIIQNTSVYATGARLLSTSASSDNYDIAIVGGGIVGLATARKLIIDHPNLKFVVLEKENELAVHQSGHNSGVIHAGIYYKPGTLKAKLCVQGLEATYKYCDEHKLPYKKVGKLIVATSPEQVNMLDELYDRGIKNNVRDLKVLSAEEIKKVEPNCRGLKALHSPHTGIVDWALISRHYGLIFQKHGGTIKLNYKVDDFIQTSSPDYPVGIVAESGSRVNAKYVITCGGLYSDRLALKSGCGIYPKIVPFRGDYLLLKPEKSNLVNGNIYPVPNPKFPFLGVHFTPRMDGSVWLGPNAVLAFKREGYNLLDFDIKDTLEELQFSGLRKLILKNISYGIGEMYRGFSISATVKELQKFVPSLKVSDVERGPSGVRAQALDNDGNLVDDFVFDSGTSDLAKRMLHVRNAPSPAATSSLSIANVIAEEVNKRFLKQ